MATAAGFGLLVPSAWGQTPSSAATLAKVKREIEEASHRSDAAYKRRDVKTAMLVYTEDFQGQGVSGNVWNKQQAEESLTKTLTLARSVNGDSRLQKVMLLNGSAEHAVVLSRDRSEITLVNQKTGNPHVVVFTSDTRNEWIKQNGQWKLRRTKQLTRTITRDGQPVTIKGKSSTKS